MHRFNVQSFRVAFLLALGLGTLAAAPMACSSTDTPVKPGGGSTSSSAGGCVGGVVEDGGVCAAKCDPSKCIAGDAGVAGDTCVENQCRLRCDTHLDCQTDQHCVAAQADYSLDDAGAVTDAGGSSAVLVCEPSGKSGGFGTACGVLGTECDALLVCPDGTPCPPMDGDAGGTCAVAECKPLVCRGSGPGDADAFCTMPDCHADSDCPDGFECGVVRDPHLICNKTPPKPTGGKKPCVDPATYTQNGQTFQEGPVSLLRNMCVKRKQCAPCKTDLDCSEVASADPNGALVPIQQCVMVGGESVCARQCGVDKDCSGDYKCDASHCVPRFGACKGTGKFCEPCRNDLDCGGTATNAKICGSLFGDQRACIDNSLPDTCTTSTDCPLAPDGKHHGVCLDEVEQVLPADPGYHRCYFPYNANSNKFSCW